MKKQPEVTALTKLNIINTYFKLKQNGEKATVGAICELAGYNRCTFYRYFSDTEQLLDEVESEICNAFQNAIATNNSTSISFEIIESFTEIYQHYGYYISVLLGTHGDPRFVKKMKSIVSPIASHILGNSSESDTITQLKTEFLLSAVLATITKWYELEQPISTIQLGKLIKEMLQQGI